MVFFFIGEESFGQLLRSKWTEIFYYIAEYRGGDSGGNSADEKTQEAEAEPFGSPAAHVKHSKHSADTADDRKLQELEREVLDLKITNRGKDIFIEQLKNERGDFFEKLLSANRTMGQLEIKLNSLNEPK